MNMAYSILGLVFVFSVVFDIVKGRIRGKRGRYIERAASPVPFWLVIGLKFVLALFLLFPKQGLSIIQFGIDDSSAKTQQKVEEFKQRHASQPQQ